MIKLHSHYKTPKLLLIGGLVMALFASFLTYHFTYAEEVFPRVEVGRIDLGGKTQSAAAEALDKKIDGEIGGGFSFTYKGKTVAINPVAVAPSDPDLAYILVSFDTDKMAREAFDFGHSGSLLSNLKQSLHALVAGRQLPVYYSLNRDRFRDALRANFGSYESPARNASLTYENGAFTVEQEKAGTKMLYDEALDALQDQIRNLEFSPIILELATDEPSVAEVEGRKLLASATETLDLAPLRLQYEKEYWPIGKNLLGAWLMFEKNDETVSLSLDGHRVNQYLDSIAEKLDILPRDAKFKLDGMKVVEFQESRTGKKLNKEEVFANLKSALFDTGLNVVDLTLDLTEPTVTTADVNNLGIKELVGTATTSFAGSPKNRRHNIGVGVEKLNGLLIGPGEEFSLLKGLGEINGETGFKQELVIKGNKTIPEFGGGLCQIATTMFRTALKTGLPITARQNHSYRVPYYEPPIGMDATVYNTAPDLKFKNDTGAYILIKGRVQDSLVTFELWGARDNRTAQTTEPVVTNRVPPPPKQEIETEDLKPGEVKCAEKPHPGADAKFTYKVTYPDGHAIEKEFRSHYRPWGEVCLVGKRPEAKPATSTVQ